MSDKQFFFIDDSGSKQWETPYSRSFVDHPPSRTDENMNFWRINYFVLAGIHINQSKMSEMSTLIDKQKEFVFGTKAVEIKSEWLRNPEKRKRRYIDKYNITEDELTDFVHNFWYPLFKKEDLVIQSFVIDKRYFAGKRELSTPLGLLTQMLFDRLVKFQSDDCTVVFDQMENDIRSTKNEQGIILKVSRQEINASPFHATYSHSKIQFEKSSTSNFLQLADTVAYNVFRQFVTYGDQWEELDGQKIDVYPFLEKIVECLHCSSSGVVAGYGIVKYPDPIKKKWSK